MHETSLVWDPAKNDEVYDIIYQNILFHFAILLKENFNMWVTSGSYMDCSEGQWIKWLLEAKIASYKLYDKSFLSLVLKKGWVSDDVNI